MFSTDAMPLTTQLICCRHGTLVFTFFVGFGICWIARVLQKVSAVRGYNASLLNSYGFGVSSIIGFAIAGYYEGFGEISWLMLVIAVVSGCLYIVSANARMDGLRCIDATIFLPLHKFVSPLAALLIGLVVFQEHLTTAEWFGIALGMLVPLLLITKAEQARQSNLTKGLLLMVLSAVLAAVSAAINKYGTNLFTSVLLFASVANGLAAVFSAALYRIRKKPLASETAEIHFLDSGLLVLAAVGGLIQMISFGAFILAFAKGGDLAIVYTIHSLYIIIPIALSIVFFNEHWNGRKVFAIVVSMGALLLMK